MGDKEKIYLNFIIVLLIIFVICKCLFCWDDKNKINPENKHYNHTYYQPSPQSTIPPPSPIISKLRRNHL